MNLGMLGQEFFDSLGLVGREVVGDDVDFLAVRLVGDDVAEEGCKTFDDESGKQRVAALIAKHRARLRWLGVTRMRLLRARIDFHRFRRATGLPTRPARTPL